MESLKQKLDAFQRSKLGQFLKKFQDDQATNLASLLAWGTLSTLLPLMLGVLGVAGLVLRDPEALDKVYSTILVLVPSDSGPIGDALKSVRENAGASAGIVGLALLLYNGSKFFANMASVFNQAYHVEGRNIVVQTVISVVMLIICTALLVVSTLAFSLGSLVDDIPFILPVGPILGRVVSWSISILTACLTFVLIYKILPNARQGWRNVLPGAMLATVLFFTISLVFPLYTSLFPPNQAYAVFGIFLVFTFWLYLLGMVFVLGAEVNAFLQEPARSVALSEAQADAQKGHADYVDAPGQVRAEAVGTAPSMAPVGPLGAPTPKPQPDGGKNKPGAAPQQQRGRGSLGGKVLGLVGLIVAAIMLRGKSAPVPKQA